MTQPKNNPTVSVIVPSYNRADFLPRAIKSILSQTFRDFEVIVVDDCSTDNTQEVARSFNDERIRYIKHDRNKGAGAARNTGIKDAKAPYVAFLDSDDEWLPEKLEEQINRIRTLPDEIGVVYCDRTVIVEKTGRIIKTSIPKAKGNAHAVILRYCALASCSTLIRKNCFEKVGFFDETLPCLEDWEMWMRVSKHYEFDLIPKVLAKSYIHGDQLTTELKGKIQARETILRKHYNDLAEHSSILADHLNRLGILHSAAGNLETARGYFMESIRKRPLQRLAYLHLVPLLLAPQTYRNILNKRIVKNTATGISLYW